MIETVSESSGGVGLAAARCCMTSTRSTASRRRRPTSWRSGCGELVRGEPGGDSGPMFQRGPTMPIAPIRSACHSILARPDRRVVDGYFRWLSRYGAPVPR